MNNLKTFKGYIFWTWDISLHTACVFEEAGKHTDVIVAYSRQDTRQLGRLPLLNIQSVQITNRQQVDELIEKAKDHVHVNSCLKPWDDAGIKLLNYALKQILRKRLFCISLCLEQFQWWGAKGFLRRFKWGYLFKIGYARRIRALGCTGWTGVEAHRKSYVAAHKLFDFIYSVPTNDSYLIGGDKPRELSAYAKHMAKSQSIEFVYVGQLTSRKSVIEMIDTFNSLRSDYNLTIIGIGALKNEVNQHIGKNTHIKAIGKLLPIDIRDILSQADALILPSKSEGWGCVVNEALMCGCRAIVSDAVGARALIDKDKKRGDTFISENWESMASCINRTIKHGKLSNLERESIKQWAQAISPAQEADYLVAITNYYSGITNIKPIAPWSLQNDN